MVDAIGTKGAAIDRAVARVLAAQAATPMPAPAGAPQPATDVASLSGVATELAATPPVDADRVGQIRRAIANGTFPLLPATVADRLLAVRYEWLGRDQA